MPKMNKKMVINKSDKKVSMSKSLSRLARYCRTYLPFILIAVTLAIASSVLSLIGPDKITKLTNIISGGIFTGIDVKEVGKIAITLVIIYAVGAICGYLQGLIMTLVTNAASKRLRSDINKKINNVPLKYIDSKSTGDVMSRLTNDVDLISQALNTSVSSLISSITLVIGCLIMMFKTNWIMALAAVISSIIGFVIMMIIVTRSQKYFVKQQADVGHVNGHIEEMYTNHSVVRISNAIRNNKKEFEKLNGDLYKSNFFSQFMSGLMFPIMGFIGNLGYVAVCVTGAVLVKNGTILIGVITGFMVYVRLFSQPLTQIAQGMNYLQQASAASSRVFDFLDEKEVENEDNKVKLIDNVKGDVVFDHVKFGYDENKEIIHDFSVHVKPGQKVAIVGPTGAGKTTLVNLLMRFYETNAGEIKIDGISTKEMSRKEVHSLFSMVLQDTWLFDGTIRANLKFNNPELDDKIMKDDAQVCGVHHFIKALPHGYHTVLDDNLEISAGQKQLLTITRAMIQNSPMLILDEATSSVDTRTELVIQKAMDELTHNRTSFIIAHRLSTIKNADIILVLNNGDIVEQGNHETLMKKNGFYADLYNSQFEAAK